MEGIRVGIEVEGISVGKFEGIRLGVRVKEGIIVGDRVGFTVGFEDVGLIVGKLEGRNDGL